MQTRGKQWIGSEKVSQKGYDRNEDAIRDRK